MIDALSSNTHRTDQDDSTVLRMAGLVVLTCGIDESFVEFTEGANQGEG